MKLYVTGNVNEYYVQTLCMIFFPGEKFSGEEEPGAPVMWMDVTEDETQVTAKARLCYRGKETNAEKVYLFDEENTADRTRKIAVGHAVLSTAGEMMHYRPSWGMLTGVRPSKVATEMLLKGMSKTQVRKKLASQYQVLTKRQRLPPTWLFASVRSSARPTRRIAACISRSRSVPRVAPTARSCPIPPSVFCP